MAIVDKLLKTQYWFYLRGASTIYQANINTPATQLFFTIYRNLVGTFLVITTWQKSDQRTQINTFVRIGNGFEANSGANYDPVDYLVKAELVHENHIPTNPQYYCLVLYVNHVGTFLSLSSYNLADKTSSINTFVRLGDGVAEGANYGPVEIRPSMLELTNF